MPAATSWTWARRLAHRPTTHGPTMSTILTEILIIIALLVVNGVFAMSELAIVSAKRVRLEKRAERGDEGARVALALASDSADFLSTVQVGITLVGVIASVFGGATIARILAGQLASVAWIGRHAEPVALALVVAGITFLSLIIGELVPKRIALANPERVAALVSRPMRLIARFARPVVAVLTGASNLVLRLLGLRGPADPNLTEEEIHALVEQGAESGVLPENEHEMVEGIFRLGDRLVTSIMTPRPAVGWVDIHANGDTLRAAAARATGGALLVCDGDIDQVVGVVYLHALLERCLGDRAVQLRDALAPPLFVPASMPVLRLLDELRGAGQRVAIVLDEYGGLQGLASLDDILEGIVGQLPTATGVPDVPIREAEDSWIVDGALPIEDLEEQLDLPRLAVHERRGFRTVGGLLMSRLGRLPAIGDAVQQGDLHLEVVRMNGRRVACVRISRRAAPHASPESAS